MQVAFFTACLQWLRVWGKVGRWVLKKKKSGVGPASSSSPIELEKKRPHNSRRRLPNYTSLLDSTLSTLGVVDYLLFVSRSRNFLKLPPDQEQLSGNQARFCLVSIPNLASLELSASFYMSSLLLLFERKRLARNGDG